MVGMVPPPQGAPGDGKLDGMGGATMTSTSGGGNNKTGRWSLDEKILFLYGLRKFGKGRWKKIGAYIPHRYVCVCSGLLLSLLNLNVRK
jgi:hypothetical protein